MAGEVVCSRSSSEGGNVWDLVSNTFVNSYTTNTPNSWMMVDIGARRRMAVNHYTIRGSPNVNFIYALRNWRLEASLDSTAWIPLSTHNNDTSLSNTAVNSAAHWPVQLLNPNPGGVAGYRYFRIFQFGPNAYANQPNYLIFSCMELYGTLTVDVTNN